MLPRLPPSLPHVAPARPQEMVKKGAKVVEGRNQQQRKAVRKLGKLKDLTAQPRTRLKYEACLEQFLSWLERETTWGFFGPRVMASQKPTSPMTLTLLDAMCGWSVMKRIPDFGLSLRVAFLACSAQENF